MPETYATVHEDLTVTSYCQPASVDLSSQELLTKILVFTAESAADDALKVPLPAGQSTTTIATATTTTDKSTLALLASGSDAIASLPSASKWISRRCGSVSDFRRQASRAVRAAKSVADQRGLDPHDVETLIVRLAKGWICQPKTGAGGRGGGRGGGDGGIFVGGGIRGAGEGESVFVRDAREVRVNGVVWKVVFEYILQYRVPTCIKDWISVD